MAANYGQTWWGKQWLEAFNGIDYSNRLPRGRRYAGNGSVSDIELKGTSTHADVQGRRPRPYKVKVHLPAFTAKQQQSILTAVSQSPALLAKLLNRQLPVADVATDGTAENPSVPQTLERYGSQLFLPGLGDAVQTYRRRHLSDRQ